MTRKARCVTGAYRVHSVPLTADATFRTTSGKGKVNTKSKAMMAAAGSSRVPDEDVEMMDAECTRDDGEAHDERHEDGDDHDEIVDEGGGGGDEVSAGAATNDPRERVVYCSNRDPDADDGRRGNVDSYANDRRRRKSDTSTCSCRRAR